MPKIILLRHGEAEGNVDKIFHGHSNSNLTRNGHRQARLAADFLCTTPIDVVYSSDLRRTLDTVSYTAIRRGLPVQLYPNLREIHGGKWEGIAWATLDSLFPESYGHWLKQPHLLQMPDGENMHDFTNRIETAFFDIWHKNPGKNILISTHGTAIKTLVGRLKKWPLSDFLKTPWYDNASITILEYDETGQYKFILEGENKHLGEHSTLARQTWWRHEVEGK